MLKTKGVSNMGRLAGNPIAAKVCEQCGNAICDCGVCHTCHPVDRGAQGDIKITGENVKKFSPLSYWAQVKGGTKPQDVFLWVNPEGLPRLGTEGIKVEAQLEELLIKVPEIDGVFYVLVSDLGYTTGIAGKINLVRTVRDELSVWLAGFLSQCKQKTIALTNLNCGPVREFRFGENKGDAMTVQVALKKCEDFLAQHKEGFPEYMVAIMLKDGAFGFTVKLSEFSTAMLLKDTDHVLGTTGSNGIFIEEGGEDVDAPETKH